MNKHTAKKGFTLIEMIVVLVILVITAAFGAVSLSGFIDRGQQSARDAVARTVFMAAQTALTQKYNQDRNFATLDNSPRIPDVGRIAPALSDTEKAKASNLVYLAIEPGQASGKLFDWLSPQFNDKAVLNQAILVEYNKETGRVLSAFYTEKMLRGAHVTLGYDSGSYSVYERGETARTAGYVGYYGVDDTGESIRNQPIDANSYQIILRDYTDYNNVGAPYGVLTAEITLPQKEQRDESFYFTLTLTPSEGSNESLTFTDAPGVTADFRLTDELLMYTDIDDAMQNPHRLNGRRIVSYYDEAAGKLVIVLDCVQSYGTYSPTENLSISTNYPGVQGGYLDASLTIDDGADTVVLYSDDTGEPRVHALYAGVTEDVGGPVYGVASVRHLNNMRLNTDTNAIFAQEADLYLHDYKRTPLNFTPIGNAYDPARKDANDADSFGFLGAFRNPGYQYKLYDLRVDLTVANTMNVANAGLFDTVYGSVNGVRFASSDANGLIVPIEASQTTLVKGVKSAGGIAGINRGGITNCTVLGEITATSENDAAAGGIAGGNAGTVSNCFVAANVTGARYAGGIAGSSTGQIAACEVGTASWRSSADFSRLYLSGVPFFGARVGASSYLSNKTANNTFRIVITQDGGAAGGIAGALLGAATVSDCVNAAKIEAGNEIDGAGAHADGAAGGIAGVVNVDSAAQTTVKCCHNAGAVYATESAGGLIGRLGCGRLQHSYNTGYVNREFKAVTVGGATYYLPGITRNISDNGAYKSGGIVGYGSSSEIAVIDCYSAQYTGNRFGGGFGVMNRDAMTTGKIDQCSFLMNALNNTDVHYVETSGGTQSQILDASKRLRMYSPQFLRTAPSDGKLDSSYFAVGSTNPGVGVFRYTYPTLNVDSGKASAAHRTPCNPVITSFGTVKLARHDTSSTSYYLSTTFTLTPDEEARLKFIARYENGTDVTFYVPIYQNDFETLHRHADGNYGGDDHDYVYGYLNGIPSGAAMPDFTLEIRSFTATMATDGYDGYKYALYFDYLTGSKSGLDSIRQRNGSKLSLFEVWLYNKAVGYGADDKVDYDSLSLSSRIWVDNGQGYVTEGRELCFAVRSGNNAATTIKINYDDGAIADQTIEVTGNDWNKAPSSFSSAITSFWVGTALRFTTDSAKRFPYYITGTGTSCVLHVVLWYNSLIGYAKPNGINSVNSGVTVEITRNGSTVTQHFAKLEA